MLETGWMAVAAGFAVEGVEVGLESVLVGIGDEGAVRHRVKQAMEVKTSQGLMDSMVEWRSGCSGVLRINPPFFWWKGCWFSPCYSFPDMCGSVV